MVTNNPTAYIRDTEGIMWTVVAKIAPGEKPTVELTLGSFRATFSRQAIETLETFFNHLDSELIEAKPG